MADYTDEELYAIAGIEPPRAQPEYTDEELFSIAGIEPPQAGQAPVIEEGSRGLAGDVVAFQKGLADTTTFGFGDEMKAVIQAGMSQMLGKPVSYDEAYGYFLNKAREGAQAAQQESPYMYTGGQVAGAFVPAAGATTGMRAIAAANPIRTGAGLGALQGGLYGAGSAEENRAQAGAIGGAIGGGAGVAGGYLAGQAGRMAGALGERMRPMTEKALQKFSRQSQEVVPAVSDDLGRLITRQDKILSQTKGQRTQLPQAQRLENDAKAGLLGEQAERMARAAEITQSRERKNLISALGNIERTEAPNDLVENVAEMITQQSKDLKGAVNDAYALAREGGGVRIKVDDIKDGLFAKLGQIKRENQYDLNTMPQASARVKDLTRLIRGTQGGKFTEASLSGLENWRKRVTNAANSTQDKTERRFLNDMLSGYDDFMYKTANEAVDKNDEAAILAFRDAVSKRREYGKLYESDRFVNDIVTGVKGLDDVAKDLLGTGSIVGKKRMEKTYDALIKAAGDEAPLVKQDLQDAFAKKILNMSIQGLEAGSSEAPFISAAKTQTALKGLFENNKNFAKKLYGEEALSVMQQAIKELEPIARQQSSTANPSGSGELVLRALDRTGFLAPVSYMMRASKEAGAEAQLQRNLAEISQEIPLIPRSKLFGASVAGQQTGETTTNILEGGE